MITTSLPGLITPIEGLTLSQGLAYSVWSNFAMNAKCAATCHSIKKKNEVNMCNPRSFLPFNATYVVT